MELADYWRILRAHWPGVLLIVGACVGLAGAYTLGQPEVYAADASGFVTTGASGDPGLASINDSLAKSRAVSYVDIATSRATAEAVIDDLGLDDSASGLVGRIFVEQPEETVLLKVTARAGTPRAAQQLADAWVRALADQVSQLENPEQRKGSGFPQVLPVEAAALPSSPASPDPARNLLLGGLAGVLLGAGYAVVRKSVDRRLRTKDDIEGKFRVSVVGTIPETAVLRREPGRRSAVAVESSAPSPVEAPAAEAFRKLRTNLMYMNVDDPPRVVVVTSPLPGDGKSTVAANLASAVDSSGQDVILVDGDLRRPTVAASFGLVEEVGLSDVLAGRVAVEEALQASPGHRGLRVLAAGSIPPNPSELLGSKSMLQLLQRLSTDALVVVDAPPLLPVTDAAVLGARADGVFVVVSAGRTVDLQLSTSLEHLDAVDATTLGVVLNRVPLRSGSADVFGGYYGPQSAAVGKRRAGRTRR